MFSSNSMITIFYHCQDKDENSRRVKVNVEALPREKGCSKMHFFYEKETLPKKKHMDS